MGLFSCFYGVRFPLILISVVFYVAIVLVDGSHLGQRIAVGVLALASIAVQAIATILVTVRTWGLLGKRRSAPKKIRITLLWLLLPFIDTFFGLSLAWGAGVFAFYSIDTTANKHIYFLFDHVEANKWVRAVSFWAAIFDPIVATNALHWAAVHIGSRLFLAAQGVFHYFYGAVFLTIGVGAAYERIKESFEKGETADPEEGREMSPPATPPFRPGNKSLPSYVKLQTPTHTQYTPSSTSVNLQID